MWQKKRDFCIDVTKKKGFLHRCDKKKSDICIDLTKKKVISASIWQKKRWYLHRFDKKKGDICIDLTKKGDICIDLTKKKGISAAIWQKKKGYLQRCDKKRRDKCSDLTKTCTPNSSWKISIQSHHTNGHAQIKKISLQPRSQTGTPNMWKTGLQFLHTNSHIKYVFHSHILIEINREMDAVVCDGEIPNGSTYENEHEVFSWLIQV